MPTLTSTLVDQSSRNSVGTSVSSFPIGTASSDRVVHIFVNTNNSGIVPAGATIGGIAAIYFPSGFANGLGWLSANVPTGTTGTVTIPNASSGFITFGGFITTGDPLAYIVRAASNSATVGPFTPVSTSAFPVNAGDCLLAGASIYTATAPTISYTGVTAGGTPFADTTGSFDLIGATDYASATSQAVTVSYTGGGANTGTYLFAAQVTSPLWILVGETEAAVNASGNYTLTEPAGTAQNDMLVVALAARSTVIFTNADFIFPQSDRGGNTTNATTASDTSGQSGYCLRGASAPTLVFSRTGGSRSLGTMRAYRSNTGGVPTFDTSGKFFQTVAGTGITLTGGITTAAAGELIVTDLFLARGAASNNSSAMNGVTEVLTASGALSTVTPPSTGIWTERSDRGNTTSPTVALSCYDAVKTSAGSTGNLTATAASSALNGMIVMAFKSVAPAGDVKGILSSVEHGGVAAKSFTTQLSPITKGIACESHSDKLAA